MKKVIIVLLILFVSFPNAQAHPGNTAADGCHYCRTNCDKWGVPWNQRHCHNSPPHSPAPTPICPSYCQCTKTKCNYSKYETNIEKLEIQNDKLKKSNIDLNAKLEKSRKEIKKLEVLNQGNVDKTNRIRKWLIIFTLIFIGTLIYLRHYYNKKVNNARKTSYRKRRKLKNK
ncbi:MAG: hypothetical protein GF332_03025 [Candidatus Moranbacteria bacterium]|nr:hypothetical protein [Candidatus Moranbacteria bacterium]